MKKEDKKKTVRMQTMAICSCLCLLAVGAGVTYRAFDQSHLEQSEPEKPVSAVHSPTIEMAALEREKQSNDPGKEPEVETQTSAQQKETKLTFAYPVEGNVVLPYSMDHAIYDPTLEQYRTNASISISAAQGADVQAAADGTVQAVTVDGESGNTITIAHKDGWLTTYGQLEDAVKVKAGEQVKQGQVIGSVDQPTKYGVALGSHLEFAMEQKGEPKDPVQHLEKVE